MQDMEGLSYGAEQTNIIPGHGGDWHFIITNNCHLKLIQKLGAIHRDLLFAWIRIGGFRSWIVKADPLITPEIFFSYLFSI